LKYFAGHINELVVAGAAKDRDRMGEKVGYGVEGLDCAFGAAGKIQDEGVADGKG
jgi:hypothetical protein